MSKPTKKRNKYNQLAIQQLAKKYNTSIVYVRQCLRGERTSQKAEILQKEYKTLDKSLTEVLIRFNDE
jgi:hypothetical protein